MTTQKDGFLRTNQSYDFNQTTNGFQKSRISTDKLLGWQKDFMYRTSYSQYHSKVIILISRTLSNLGFLPFPSMEALCLFSNLKMFTVKALLR